MWLKAQEKGIVLLVMQKALRSGCCLSLEQKQYIVNWSFEKTGFRGFRSKCCCKMTFCCGRLFPTVSECLPSRHCDRALRGQTDHDPVTSVSSKSACLSLSAHMLLRRGSLASFSFSGLLTDWLAGCGLRWLRQPIGVESSGSGKLKAGGCCWAVDSSCLGCGRYCLRPGFCCPGVDLLQILLVLRKLMVFTTGMIEFPSVCHVLF